ncbi:MAG: hypothetical protein Q8S33_25710 [Myxococcales bacterium]|nr:hypothetical protein [Myxococcales bacterium]
MSRPSHSAWKTCGVAALMTALAVDAEPMARDINPGVLGPNALPTLPSEAPWVADEVHAQLGWSGQLSTPEGGGLDASMLVPFRVEVGLFKRVAFAVFGSPFELWQYSPETNAAWVPRRSRGITRADVLLSTKVLLWNEASFRPASALRVTLKTATGEDLYTRRFLDAPAYQFDLLNAWHWNIGVTRLEAWAAVGFLAWQQGAVGQNDAVTLAGTLVARWALVNVRLELRGYAGWQRMDSPITLATVLELRLTESVDVLVNASRTFRDPPFLDVGAAVRIRIPN